MARRVGFEALAAWNAVNSTSDGCYLDASDVAFVISACDRDFGVLVASKPGTGRHAKCGPYVVISTRVRCWIHCHSQHVSILSTVRTVERASNPAWQASVAQIAHGMHSSCRLYRSLDQIHWNASAIGSGHGPLRASRCMRARRCRKGKGKADAAQPFGGMDLALYVPTPDGYVRAAEKWTRESVGFQPGVSVLLSSGPGMMRAAHHRRFSHAASASYYSLSREHCRFATRRVRTASSDVSAKTRAHARRAHVAMLWCGRSWRPRLPTPGSW